MPEGFVGISVKAPARDELSQWQFFLQHTLGRRVSVSDALRIAVATARQAADAYSGMLIDPTQEASRDR